uniref:C6 domain-containing protein n=1 Tax=Panagrellus redivivus TaxID=6233 RepID=A0A7E4VD89_PANRE
MTSVLATLLFLANGLAQSNACLATSAPTSTTTTPLCCAPLSTSNPPRVNAPDGTPGGALDECAVLRRIQRGECPTTAEIVCSAARGMSVDEVILQFLTGSTVVASATGTTRASATITCTADGYRVTNAAGNLVAFDAVSCTQRTLEGPDFTDYYASGSKSRASYYG